MVKKMRTKTRKKKGEKFREKVVGVRVRICRGENEEEKEGRTGTKDEVGKGKII